jgi:hypothetical protein
VEKVTKELLETRKVLALVLKKVGPVTISNESILNDCVGEIVICDDPITMSKIIRYKECDKNGD